MSNLGIRYFIADAAGPSSRSDLRLGDWTNENRLLEN
jgi:hypothetical protein